MEYIKSQLREPLTSLLLGLGLKIDLSECAFIEESPLIFYVVVASNSIDLDLYELCEELEIEDENGQTRIYEVDCPRVALCIDESYTIAYIRIDRIR
jgi:hypothetical protein